jgi:nitrite reductase (NADH) small subunit
MQDDEFHAAAERLDELVQALESLPYPAIREQVFEILQAVDAIHREGLGRLVESLRAQGQNEAIERAAEDPVIQSLLLLYNLLPGEELIQAEPEPPPLPMTGFIPLAQIDPAPLRRPVFKEVARLADVLPGTMRDFQMDGVYVLVANVGGEVYAVRDHCPGGAAPLRLGSFSAPILVCPWHNEAYDIRTGKRADGVSGPGLTVLPVAVVGESIQLAINILAEAAPVGP